jgi:hypothetical protein
MEDKCLRAIDNDDIKELEKCINAGYKIDNKMIDEIVYHDRYEIMKYLHENGYNITYNLYEGLIKNGNYEGMKYFQKKNIPMTEDAMEEALSVKYYGDEKGEKTDKYVKYIMKKHGCELIDGNSICSDIIKNKDLEMFKIIVEKEYRRNYMFRSFEYNFVDGIEYLIECGHKIEDKDIEWIIKMNYGGMNSLRYLKSNGYNISERHLEICSLHGNLEGIKYLHENGVKITEIAFNNSIRENKLDCVKYMHKNGCEMNVRTMESGLENDSGKCVRYMLEYKCPYDKRDLAENIDNFASEGKYKCVKEIIRYIRSGGKSKYKDEFRRIFIKICAEKEIYDVSYGSDEDIDEDGEYIAYHADIGKDKVDELKAEIKNMVMNDNSDKKRI